MKQSRNNQLLIGKADQLPHVHGVHGPLQVEADLLFVLAGIEPEHVFERDLELIENTLYFLLLDEVIDLASFTAFFTSILSALLIVRVHTLLDLTLHLLLLAFDCLLPRGHILPLLNHRLERLLQLLLLLTHELLPIRFQFL